MTKREKFFLQERFWGFFTEPRGIIATAFSSTPEAVVQGELIALRPPVQTRTRRSLAGPDVARGRATPLHAGGPHAPNSRRKASESVSVRPHDSVKNLFLAAPPAFAYVHDPDHGPRITGHTREVHFPCCWRKAQNATVSGAEPVRRTPNLPPVPPEGQSSKSEIRTPTPRRRERQQTRSPKLK